MAGIGTYKLADAVPRPQRPAVGARGGKPAPSHAGVAERARETEESKGASAAAVSSRDRMVDIGRGQQQAGRQGQ